MDRAVFYERVPNPQRRRKMRRHFFLRIAENSNRFLIARGKALLIPRGHLPEVGNNPIAAPLSAARAPAIQHPARYEKCLAPGRRRVAFASQSHATGPGQATLYFLRLSGYAFH